MNIRALYLMQVKKLKLAFMMRMNQVWLLSQTRRHHYLLKKWQVVEIQDQLEVDNGIC
ncbi:hypothetical protein N480_09725 [Pseudoalteromonas luteoviolacea S2607]|nr:hypothetical protein N480_09725 [Pseudoalteromonas luteoviolacea S2607]